MVIDGFTDVSALLRGGIYILISRGEVVFVGKASSQMLARITTHRSLAKKSAPPWVPIQGVVFDQVLIRQVHPDQIDEIHSALIDVYSPRHNIRIPFPSVPQPQLTRRL